MGKFHVAPDGLSQFDPRSAAFCLVTTAGRENDFKVLPSSSYSSTTIVPLGLDQNLESLLEEGCVPDAADVLVVCPDRFLVSPNEQTIGKRRIAVLPCGSTPTTSEQIAYFLAVLHRCDVTRQERFCARLVDTLEQTVTLRLVDAVHDTVATFQVSDDYEWNQQAGIIEPGEQQVAPPGEFSALPTGINSFDDTRRLKLNGSLTVLGPPIVHRANRGGLINTQAQLFAAFDATRAAPLRLDVADGLIIDWQALDRSAEPAVEAFFELFELDERYRIVWEFGIGCNETIDPQAGNCGMNEMYGSEQGVLHLGLGLTPTTDYAITLCCRQTCGLDDAQRPIFGAKYHRINRVRSRSCGCIG